VIDGPKASVQEKDHTRGNLGKEGCYKKPEKMIKIAEDRKKADSR